MYRLLSCTFQSTLLREERLLHINYYFSVIYFNPRSCERSDGKERSGQADHRHFNPRSCERSDSPAAAPLSSVVSFQSTLLREERPIAPVTAAPIFNFNPRSCERSDQFDTFFANYEEISIHAPARGATLSCPALLRPYRNFNPRSCERSDHKPKEVLCIGLKISIHAPARGAT